MVVIVDNHARTVKAHSRKFEVENGKDCHREFIRKGVSLLSIISARSRWAVNVT